MKSAKALLLLLLVCLCGCGTSAEDGNKDMSDMMVEKSKMNAAVDNINENAEDSVNDEENSETDIYLNFPDGIDIFSTDQKEVYYRVVNQSAYSILLGEEYTIERNVGDEWILLPMISAYEDIAYEIVPNSERDFICSLNGISDTGTYRIVKHYIVDDSFDATLRRTVTIEFQVR